MYLSMDLVSLEYCENQFGGDGQRWGQEQEDWGGEEVEKRVQGVGELFQYSRRIQRDIYLDQGEQEGDRQEDIQDDRREGTQDAKCQWISGLFDVAEGENY